MKFHKTAKEMNIMNAEELARMFHKTYEELAPQFGYETREDTREFDPESANGKLMVAVCKKILMNYTIISTRCNCCRCVGFHVPIEDDNGSWVCFMCGEECALPMSGREGT